MKTYFCMHHPMGYAPVRLVCLLLLMGVMLPASLTAQAPPYDKLALKVSPLALIDPNRSHVLLSAELRPVRQMGVEISYGIQVKDFAQYGWNTVKSDRDYHILRGEVRVYPAEHKRLYWAFEGFRVWEDFRLTDYFYENEAGAYRAFDEARISRRIWGICPKMGYVLPLNARIRLDMYAGLGYRFRNQQIKATHERSPDFDIFDTFWLILSEHPVQGQFNFCHVAAGFRLSMVLKSGD
ncbi:MAG: hypothetical protein SF053_09885 [Bacteroidia bacterium]|nr:hypothetical protein [Bacteroidia bacterium]